MNRRSLTIFLVAGAFIASAAGLLASLQGKQKLGAPGVRTMPTEDPKRLKVVLPEKVLDYTSEEVPVDQMTMDVLPADTSFGQRRYTAPDGFAAALNVVLMGADRTSLHKPQFCLAGIGFSIDPVASRAETIRVTRPHEYDLPVMKFIATREVAVGGQTVRQRGVYVYYYVADRTISAGAHGGERMVSMAREMLRSGTLQRWAYISYFSVCVPGQEEATYQRMRDLIAASVPEFQLAAGPSKMAAK